MKWDTLKKTRCPAVSGPVCYLYIHRCIFIDFPPFSAAWLLFSCDHAVIGITHTCRHTTLPQQHTTRSCHHTLWTSNLMNFSHSFYIILLIICCHGNVRVISFNSYESLWTEAVLIVLCSEQLSKQNHTFPRLLYNYFIAYNFCLLSRSPVF